MPMITEAVYTLDKRVEIRKVSDLSASVRGKLVSSDTDFIISLKGSRERGKVVTQEAQRLLEIFRAPKKIIDAVTVYAAEYKEDPEQVLRDSFPLLKELISCRWLVTENDFPCLENEGGVDVLPGVALKRALQVLDDTCVYEAIHPRYGHVCIKYVRNDSPKHLLNALKREACLLQRLPKDTSPYFHEEGQTERWTYLVIEFVQGIAVSRYAAKLRSTGNVDGLKQCARNILNAYKKLHENGFLHGDIHPGNILVKENAEICLLDFGYGWTKDLPEDLKKVPRNVIEYFQEPELAQAILNKERRPAASIQGEQYALGALLFQLLTGQHYVDFSYDKLEQSRQVCESAPRIELLASFGVEVASVIAKMLQKDPSKRFAGLSGINVDWGKGASDDVKESRPALIRLLSLSPREMILEEPSASLNFGAAGVAYAMYELSQKFTHPQLLTMADAWISRARSQLMQPGCGLTRTEWGIDPESDAPSSLFHGRLGVLSVQILTSMALADGVTEISAFKEFCEVARLQNPHIDVTFGSAGVLIAVTRLIRAGNRSKELRKVGEAVSQIVSNYILEQPCIGQRADGDEYLGFAHGWCGVLYALIDWNLLNESFETEILEDRMQQLLALCTFDSNMHPLPRMFRKRREYGKRDGSWCNGSVGLLLLLLKAYSYFRNTVYLDSAQRVGRSLLAMPSEAQSLCCGSAGIYLALKNLYAYTGDKQYLVPERILGHPADSYSFTRAGDMSFLKGQLGVVFASLNGG